MRPPGFAPRREQWLFRVVTRPVTVTVGLSNRSTSAMKLTSSLRLFVLLAAAVCVTPRFTPSCRAADVRYFLTVKGAEYSQTNTGTPVLKGATPWVFNNEVRLRLPGLVTNATVKFSNVTSNLAPECHAWYLQAAYATSNALTTAFPNGNYTNTAWTLQDGTRSPVLSVTNNQYPAGPPHVTNYTAAQAVDTTLPFKLGWDGFTGGTTNDFVLLQVDNQYGNRIFETPLMGELGALTGVSSNYTFTSNSLPPGQTLSGSLIFARGYTTTTNAAYPGVRMIAGYYRGTEFTMVTTGTPDITPPVFLQSSPWDGETNVPVNSSIAFSFDEPMRDRESVTWSGNVDSNKFSYVWTANRLTLICSYATNFPTNATISWTLNPSGTSCGAVEDLSGNQANFDQVGSFTTGNTGAGVKDVLLYGCGKQQQFVQTNSAAPTTTNGFRFESFAELSATYTITGGTVQPSNGPVQLLATDFYSSGRNFNFRQDFTNQASLDATFTNGFYIMALDCVHDGRRVATNSLTGNTYPSIPHLSNFNAAQSVNSTQSFTLTWDAFAGGTTNDFIQVNVSGNNGDVFSSPQMPGLPGALNGLSNSIVIPAGVLAPGQTYSGEVFFAKLITLNTNAYPGVTSLTYYGRRTDFNLATLVQQPGLSQPVRISPTQFQFLINGSIGQNYTIESSTTLTNWSTLYVTNAPSSAFSITDSSATNRWNFYRVRVGP